MRILVVEDDALLAEGLTSVLSRAGHAVLHTTSGRHADYLLTDEKFDLVILDVGLPDIDGFEVLRRLRLRRSATNVLVLTARDAVEDRVSGLDSGADDYLVKPFAMAELIARTKALLRRPGGALGTMLKAGNVTFDTIGRNVLVGNVSVLMPRRESAILEHLMRRLGRVVPKTVLEEKLYSFDDELESNAIPVHVHHLRRKLVDAGATAEINTVRGVGYLLTEAQA